MQPFYSYTNPELDISATRYGNCVRKMWNNQPTARYIYYYSCKAPILCPSHKKPSKQVTFSPNLSMMFRSPQSNNQSNNSSNFINTHQNRAYKMNIPKPIPGRMNPQAHLAARRTPPLLPSATATVVVALSLQHGSGRSTWKVGG